MPSFLDLPREIRDEIYLYLLIFDVSPDPDHQIKKFPWERFERCGLDVSILRLNRQIHDEASEILYGWNTFPLRICVEGSGVRDGRPEHWFAVAYESLWEDVNYTCHLGKGFAHEPLHGVRDMESSKLWFNRVTDSRFCLPPAPRYRHLLRHFCISIRDYRSSQWVAESAAPKTLVQRNRRILKSILKPLERRFESLIAQENQMLHLDITIRRSMHSNGYPFAEIHGPMALHNGYYHQLAYLAWPLTTGRWTNTLKMAEPDDGMVCGFEDIKEEAWEQCTLEPGFNEWNEGGFLIQHVNRDAAQVLQSVARFGTKERLYLAATWFWGPMENQ
ncbi:hypothetical protein TWF481_009254 [Arthrobotrys musiformis]|uniref:Uncharacterized protein n=1 Tax=Arthrobotrys musiformis TaxID=47236 RepID=A0AAV9W4H4_9PEZI